MSMVLSLLVALKKNERDVFFRKINYNYFNEMNSNIVDLVMCALKTSVISLMKINKCKNMKLYCCIDEQYLFSFIDLITLMSFCITIVSHSKK